MTKSPQISNDSGEIQFTSDWLRRRGEVIALTGQWTGLGLHFLTVLLAPFIGNKHSIDKMYLIFGSFFVAGLLLNSIVNWIGKGARLNFWFFSVCYSAAIAYFLHLGTTLEGAEFINEMLVTSGSYIVVIVILLLLCPFHSPVVVIGTAGLYFAFGAWAISGTEFASRWQVICALAASFAAAWHIIETRKSLHSAKDFYRQSKQLAQAEKATSEAMARESHARIQTMVATTQMLAHDLRNPLALFKSFFSLIQGTEGQSTVSLVHRFEGELNRSLETMDSMIGDVMEAGSTPLLTWSDFDLDQLVVDSLHAVFHDRLRSTVLFKYNWSLKSQVRGDRVKFLRVISNIVKNASEAMNQSGIISFTASPSEKDADKFVTLRIHNSGTYISEEDRMKIFDAFFTKGKTKGTGLGLAIARRFLEAHGGTIECSSDKNDGTSFSLTLPVSANAASPQLSFPRDSREISSSWISNNSTQETADASKDIIADLLKTGRSFSVLVVDDESLYIKLVRELVAPIRKDLKIKVDGAESIEQALELAAYQKFDLIVCDVDLGDDSGNGYTLIEQLRKKGSTAYICMHSNRMLPGDQIRSVNAGADASIPKPIGKPQLLQLLSAKALSDKKVA